MAKNDLRHLNRRELLELLIEVSEENERLREEIQQLKRQTDHSPVSMEDPESGDELVARLNSLIRQAQQTCDTYIAQTKRHAQERQTLESAGEAQVQEPEPPAAEEMTKKTVHEDEELCVCEKICLSKKISEVESGDGV